MRSLVLVRGVAQQDGRSGGECRTMSKFIREGPLRAICSCGQRATTKVRMRTFRAASFVQTLSALMRNTTFLELVSEVAFFFSFFFFFFGTGVAQELHGSNGHSYRFEILYLGCLPSV